MVLKANSDVAGMYYTELDSDTSVSPAEASAIMDGYQWEEGWRFSDNEEKEIYNAGCPECLFQEYLPRFIVIDSHTMEIYSYNPIGFDGMLEDIQEIDALYP